MHHGIVIVHAVYSTLALDPKVVHYGSMFIECLRSLVMKLQLGYLSVHQGIVIVHDVYSTLALDPKAVDYGFMIYWMPEVL